MYFLPTSGTETTHGFSSRRGGCISGVGRGVSGRAIRASDEKSMFTEQREKSSSQIRRAEQGGCVQRTDTTPGTMQVYCGK